MCNKKNIKGDRLPGRGGGSFYFMESPMYALCSLYFNVS